MMHKPLYTVQCSQLGMNPEELEKELGIVLSRANRWKCVLLIDEADVYVRNRGEDIAQNAMVGTWLRVLEYYRGIMFMTSNRATIIDDAIMSRATAWIQYPRPSIPELHRIWSVLLAQYEVEAPTELIEQLVKQWPNITGRNVKNMIKLARQLGLARPEKELLQLFTTAADFLDLRHDHK
jgi:SpoVK/Ycf46/Vps4 family AAA+-type ATPase